MINTITIPNIQAFRQQIINGNLLLTRIVPFIDEATLFQKNILGSTILECKINNVNKDIRKYKKLLIRLYSIITDIEMIVKNTILNISREERYDKGFNYCPQFGISIQGADAKRTLNEIINITKNKHYNIELKIELKIKLKSNEVIHFIVCTPNNTTP